STFTGRQAVAPTAGPGAVDMKLEVVVLPVSDVERAKGFYGGLGWRLDADFSAGDVRVVQFTPPGSACSIHIGRGVTSPRAVPRTARGCRSAIPTGIAGWSRKSARDVPVAEKAASTCRP